jgi:hypothetical protein
VRVREKGGERRGERAHLISFAWSWCHIYKYIIVHVHVHCTHGA